MERRVLLITDTLCDANGVSRFIQDIAQVSLNRKKSFKFLTSTNKTYCKRLENIVIFKPLIDIKMPYYAELSLVVPPFIKIYRFIKEYNPSSIHISTPGTIGLFALIVAKFLKIPIFSTYHTDFASYIYSNSKSRLFMDIARFYEKWFYRRCKSVFLRSFVYRGLIRDEFKISEDKIVVIPAGIDIDRFDINKRDKAYFEQFGIPKDATIALYVGRVTKEKNIEFLIEVWKNVYKKGFNTWLVLVGSGSFLKRQNELLEYNIKFLGHRDRDELSIIYPSSDFFIFPSNTDTLGQVVIEAMANGLPVLVSNMGGPKSLVTNFVNGFVLKKDSVDIWSSYVNIMINSKVLREKFSKNAFKTSKNLSIDKSFEFFWSKHI